MNQEHPKTFEIPSEKARQGIKKGDVVKLVFEVAVPHSNEFGGLSGERMWVGVERRKGAYFIGKLLSSLISPSAFTKLTR